MHLPLALRPVGLACSPMPEGKRAIVMSPGAGNVPVQGSGSGGGPLVALSAFSRCAAGTDVRSVCAGLVDDLYGDGRLPSVYLLVDGRLRCQASRGYFQVSDGFGLTSGVAGQVVRTGETAFLPDVTLIPSFFAAVPGLKSEVCVAVRVDGRVVGIVNVESRSSLDESTVALVSSAAEFLGHRIKQVGGVGAPSLAEQVALIAVSVASQRGDGEVQALTARGALALTRAGGAAIALVDAHGTWSVSTAEGRLAGVLRSWTHPVLTFLSGWVAAGTSSYFPDGEEVPAGYEFLRGGVAALAIYPLIVAGHVTGMLLTVDSHPGVHGPSLSAAMELLATQAAATLAIIASLGRLEDQARHDQLTGLLNRRALMEQVQSASDDSDAAAGEISGLVLLDLDGFKAVNDSFGHAAGDQLLREVAARLTSCTREADLVARLGGDEFAVLIRHPSTATEVMAAAERMVQAILGLAADGRNVRTGVSAGVRVADRVSSRTLLADADLALYAAKRAGGGRAVLWQPALNTAEQAQDELFQELVVALAADALTVLYEPVFDIVDLRVQGLEALARWQHPERGDVPTAILVSCAERGGIVRTLTQWVLARALRDAASWPQAADGSALDVGINISGAQLADNMIVDDVRSALAASGVTASRVVLEVTETSQVIDLGQAQRTLTALSALGVRLALDGFGTGHSSLTHVNALPFDILKIDRAFIAAASTGERRALATIAAVGALATRLDVDVVAEGVEDRALLPELADLGCRYAQGFALARPLTSHEVSAALKTHERGSWRL